MVTGMAVYMLLVKMAKFNIDNPFTSPLALGIGPCLGMGICLAVAMLWPNRYTIILLSISLLLWFCLGCLISSSAAC